MSPELETLDQLAGNDMPLPVIRQVYPDKEHFSRGMCALLACGEIRLVSDGESVPEWRWREVLESEPLPNEISVRLTNAGARRIM